MSLLYSFTTDTRRKDFYEVRRHEVAVLSLRLRLGVQMVIHHIATILLLGFSWAYEY